MVSATHIHKGIKREAGLCEIINEQQWLMLALLVVIRMTFNGLLKCVVHEQVESRAQSKCILKQPVPSREMPPSYKRSRHFSHSGEGNRLFQVRDPDATRRARSRKSWGKLRLPVPDSDGTGGRISAPPRRNLSRTAQQRTRPVVSSVLLLQWRRGPHRRCRAGMEIAHVCLVPFFFFYISPSLVELRSSSSSTFM